jgi:anti-sigma regulatory factor (Ser/Thr protein kinase)
MKPALCVSLEPHPLSPSIARSYAVELVEPWASNGLVLDLGLLVTELVANAVLHGAPRIRLEIATDMRATIRVEVFDGSTELPTLLDFPNDGLSGRGLRIVDALATDWGARRQGNGKVVWFELHDNANRDLRNTEARPRRSESESAGLAGPGPCDRRLVAMQSRLLYARASEV